MTKNIFGVVLFIVFILLLPNVEAVEDQVYFYAGGGLGKETNIVYVGEYDIGIRVIFGQNCTNYSFETNSLLFKHPLYGIIPDSIKGGEVHDLGREINPDAQIGKYSIIFYLNYTNENKIRISRQFNLTLEYKKSFEIKEMNIPKEKEREFSFTIKTFEKFTKLKVEFDSDGDIETEKHEVILENVSVGNYTFKTKIYKVKTHAGDAQELGYWVIGTVNNRTVELGEQNIPVKISWTEEGKRDEEEIFIPGFEIIFLMISIFILLIFKKKD
jgi:hypothetical protein